MSPPITRRRRRPPPLNRAATGAAAGLAAALAVALAAGRAAAAPYTGMVVFGDSLSDVGNDALVTANLSAFGIPPTPGPYYDTAEGNRRFSNGPTYVDDLTAKLGLTAPVPSVTLTNGLATGGTGHAYDFAYGGARTAGSSALQREFIHDVDQQVGGYLAANAPVATDLFVVFAGANDLSAQSTAAPAAATAAAVGAADNLRGDLAALYAAGARQFLVPNLPLLGETPTGRAAGAAAEQAADALTVVFNNELASDLTSLSAADPGIAVHRLDAATLFATIQGSPTSFGLMDAVDSAAPGLTAGATSYNTALEVPNPDQYLFWDDQHPTRAGHALLATAAYAAAVPEPTAVAGVVAIAALGLGRRRRPPSARGSDRRGLPRLV